MRVSADMPDDVLVMHDALEALRRHKPGEPLTLHLKNCGTALRFLEVHLQHCYPGEPITLTGDERLLERRGKPTTQTISARILHGEDIPVEKNESPYIRMSREMAASYSEALLQCNGPTGVADLITQWSAERCWSSASYWYEYVALHGGTLILPGLQRNTLQGDHAVARIYNRSFGVTTVYVPEGVRISRVDEVQYPRSLTLDFTDIPDLYPAVALTCERLGITLLATGTERLRYKESNRLRSVRLHQVNDDHRMAMALMAADYPVSLADQQCIRKSYPGFGLQHLTPRRGINDDNLGKKHALSKLIREAVSDYVWLHDDDVVLPPAVERLTMTDADLLILPLRMESEREHPSLLERLQIAEYAAIQELTMRTARRGRAVMCSGANMIVRREAWLACEQDLHPELPSGDDMFLLEAMKRRGMRIEVIDAPDYTAVVRPLTSWRALWRQRMRWAGKAPHYTDRDIRRCGAWVGALNLLQVVCPPILLVKFPIEYRMLKKRSATTSWAVALLLEAVYPFYMLGTLIGGLRHPKRW